MSMTPKKPSWPVPSAVMAWEEFVEATGIAPERLEELLSLGWIETRTSAARQYFFRDADIYRVRKLAVLLLWTCWSASTLWNAACAACRSLRNNREAAPAPA